MYYSIISSPLEFNVQMLLNCDSTVSIYLYERTYLHTLTTTYLFLKKPKERLLKQEFKTKGMK